MENLPWLVDEELTLPVGEVIFVGPEPHLTVHNWDQLEQIDEVNSEQVVAPAYLGKFCQQFYYAIMDLTDANFHLLYLQYDTKEMFDVAHHLPEQQKNKGNQ